MRRAMTSEIDSSFRFCFNKASYVHAISLGEDQWKFVLTLVGVIQIVGLTLATWNSVNMLVAYFGGLLYLIPIPIALVAYIG